MRCANLRVIGSIVTFSLFQFKRSYQKLSERVVKRFSKTLKTAVACGWTECPCGFKPFNDLNMFIILEYTLPT